MTTTTQFDTLPERAEIQCGLVAVAMSGGVDSSTVPALLQEQGRPVVGLTMQLWNQRRLPELQGDGPRSTAAVRSTTSMTQKRLRNI